MKRKKKDLYRKVRRVIREHSQGLYVRAARALYPERGKQFHASAGALLYRDNLLLAKQGVGK